MNGAHLWAERYDRELSDIFAIQEDITRSMVASIAPAIEDTVLASPSGAASQSHCARDRDPRLVGVKRCIPFQRASCSIPATPRAARSA